MAEKSVFAKCVAAVALTVTPAHACFGGEREHAFSHFYRDGLLPAAEHRWKKGAPLSTHQVILVDGTTELGTQ